MTFKKMFIPIFVLALAGCSTSTSNTETTSSNNTNTESTSTTTIESETGTIVETTTYETNNLEVTFLNVGKADAIILEANDDYVVIDTGLQATSNILTDALINMGCDKIDYLIITHYDKDHVGGAANLINNYEIDNIYTSYYNSESNESAYNKFINALTSKGYTDRHKIIRDTVTFSVGNVNYTIYAPLEESEYTNDYSNNSSLAIRAVNGANSFFFAGDAEKQRIKELLKLDIDSDVFKVPHHGGIEDNSEALIDLVSPKYSVITSSSDELEDETLVNLLKTYNSEVYLTREGTVTITSDANNLTVTQEKTA